MGVGAIIRRAVFLDRDGVINRAIVRDGVPHPPASLAELEVLPGVPEALELLAARGFVLIVVTNQPDVARGAQTREAVEAINQHLMQSLPLDEVFTCYHDNVDECLCRKPRPGLILQAAREYNIDLRRSFLVGDRWSDVVAGQSAGCRTFLLDAPYNQQWRCTPDGEVSSLLEAAQRIIGLPN
ncbi:MAG: HAD family hydrolase [Blastocatellia bacterium]